MVWIRCKTGEFLDPKKIRSIAVVPCIGSGNEVEIIAEYGHEKFLLYRTTKDALTKLGFQKNKGKFASIISEISKKHQEEKHITYEDIFNLMLEDAEEPDV